MVAIFRSFDITNRNYGRFLCYLGIKLTAACVGTMTYVFDGLRIIFCLRLGRKDYKPRTKHFRL
jgi:hypothetical protein